MTKLSGVINSHKFILEDPSILPSVRERAEDALTTLNELHNEYGEMVTYDEPFERVEGEALPNDELEPNYCPNCHSGLDVIHVFYKNTAVKAVFNLSNAVEEEYNAVAENFQDIAIIFKCESCSNIAFKREGDLLNMRLLGNIFTALDGGEVK